MIFRDSLELVRMGSAVDFVTVLCDEAMSHHAVNHDYLKRFANGDLPNNKEAIKDFAHQYSYYSKDFTAYLGGAIETLDNGKHREMIMENLEEEQGVENATELDKVSHKILFENFKTSTGVDEKYMEANPYCTTVKIWRDLFLQKCRSSQKGLAVGAIGIGTEYVVPNIYAHFYHGITEHTDITEEEAYFFKLHAYADVEHSEDLKSVLIDLAEDYEVREAIRFGVFSSLNLRRTFWDVMLGRAIAMKG